MKILLISPGITPYVMGGMQRHSFNLVRHLALLGVEIILYHTSFKSSQKIDGLEGMSELEKSRITSISVNWPVGDRFPGHYVRELKRFSAEVLKQYHQGEPADVIYGQGITAWSFVEAKRRGENLPPIVCNLHGYEMFQPPVDFVARLHGMLMRPSFGAHARRADYVVSLGGKLTELVEKSVGVDRRKIIETPGGIDPEWIIETPSSVGKLVRFIFVGRFERRKGIEELHAAISSHPEWEGKATFRFVGPIPEEKQLNLPGVSYAGSIRDEKVLRDELWNADVLLCPSFSEGMPTVILEAMASGLAVVATDVGATAVLVSEENGILLPSASIENVVSGVNRMLAATKGELERKKAESLRRIEGYTWGSVGKKNLEDLERVISRS